MATSSTPGFEASTDDLADGAVVGAVVKTTLILNNGKPTRPPPDYEPDMGREAGVSEAIVTCIVPGAKGAPRMELLRCDMYGGDWVTMERAGALRELDRRMLEASRGLMAAWHEMDACPRLVVTLDENRALTNGRLVFSGKEIEQESSGPNDRSLPVPRLLPHQMGGDKNGAHVLVFSPSQGGGIQVHSVHPTSLEAGLALSELSRQGERKAAVIRAATPVTRLLSDVLEGRFTPETQKDSAAAADRSSDPVATAGMRGPKESWGIRPSA